MVPEQDLPKLFGWAEANRLALFPIPKFCKRPTGIVRSHATDWSRESSQWARWWLENNGCNFGVACGPSGVIVVDVDAPGGQSAIGVYVAWTGQPQRPQAQVWTPTNGEHFYYRVPEGFDPTRLRQPDIAPRQVNVRAGAGYVVAPFCFTDPLYDTGVKAQGRYQLLDANIPLAYTKLLEHCAPEPNAAPIVASSMDLSADGYPLDDALRWAVKARVDATRARLLNAVPGERNNELNAAAFALGKIVAEGRLAEGAAQAILEEAGTRIGLPLEEIRVTMRSGLRAAPRVGRAEPRTALQDLMECKSFIAYDVPLASFPRPVPRSKGVTPDEPIVSLLAFAGDVTLLSGGSGAGKTTFAASLAAASTTDVRHFNFGSFEDGLSDVACRTGVWIFVSYEGAQYIERNVAAWHAGMGVAASHPQRFVSIEMADGPMVGTKDRKVAAREEHAAQINQAIIQARIDYPDLPITVVVDNVTSAVENSIEPEQAGVFMRAMKAIASQGCAVVVLGHPTKNGASPIYGSHILFSIADIVGTLEVLKQDNGEWVQWIDFSKHRTGVTHRSLEIRSRRLGKPMMELPPEWMADNPRERARATEDLHLPYVRTIRVRLKSDKASAKSGVVEQVTTKAEAVVNLTT